MKAFEASRIGWLAFALIWPMFLALTTLAQTAPVSPLPFDAPTEYQIAPGETKALSVQLESGDFVALNVAQTGPDVVVEIVSPAKETLLITDHSFGRAVPERSSFTAPAAGVYVINVSAFSKTARGTFSITARLIKANEKDPAANAFRTRETNFQKLLAVQLKLIAKRNDSKDKATLEAVAAGLEIVAADFRKSSEETYTADSLNALALTFNSLGRYPDAIARWIEAAAIFKKLGIKTHEQQCLNDAGFGYQNLGNNTEALRYFFESLEIKRKFGTKLTTSKTLGNIGLSQLALGKSDEALKSFTESLSLARADTRTDSENARVVTFALRNIARLKMAAGELTEALKYLTEARDLWAERKKGSEYAEALEGIAGFYSFAGDYPTALRCLDEALQIWTAAGSVPNIGRMRRAIGQVQISLKLPAEARISFNASRELFSKAGNRLEEARAVRLVGATYLSELDAIRALKLFEEARTIFPDIEFEPGFSKDVGIARRQTGDFSGAETAFRRALERAGELGRETEKADLCFLIAQTKADLGRFAEAKIFIDRCLEIVEKLKSGIASPNLRAAFQSSRYSYRELQVFILTKIAAEQKELPVAAFEAAERSRGMALREMIVESGIDISAGADPELVAHENDLARRLDQRLAARESMIQRQHSQADFDQLEKEISELSTALEEAGIKIRTANPRYANLVRPPQFGLAEIQRDLLDKETVLLEYFVGERESYLWIVEQNKFTAVTLPSKAKIDAAARAYLGKLTAKTLASEAELDKYAAALSELVLPPAAAKFAGKRLLIVSDSILSYVPFDSLKPDGKRFLIQTNEIANVVSASTMLTMRAERARRRTLTKRSIAIFADPIFELTDARFAVPLASPTAPVAELAPLESSTVIEGKSFPRLRFSRAEAASVAGKVPADSLTFLDFDATRAKVFETPLEQFRYLHFATHGIFDETEPARSGLVLSLFDKERRPVRGFLDLKDVYRLRLNADLVVLSACRSALGTEIRGEGINGLRRGLAYAGAARSISSLWSIDDRAASRFFAIFYDNLLAKKMTVAAALRATKISMMADKRFSARRFWAGFAFEGDWR